MSVVSQNGLCGLSDVHGADSAQTSCTHLHIDGIDNIDNDVRTRLLSSFPMLALLTAAFIRQRRHANDMAVELLMQLCMASLLR